MRKLGDFSKNICGQLQSDRYNWLAGSIVDGFRQAQIGWRGREEAFAGCGPLQGSRLAQLLEDDRW